MLFAQVDLSTELVDAESHSPNRQRSRSSLWFHAKLADCRAFAPSVDLHARGLSVIEAIPVS